MSTLISTADASSILKLSQPQVRKLCADGKLPAQKIGKSWVVDSTSPEFLATSPHTDGTNPLAVQKGKPIALSFFSGAMGLDLGLEASGFDIRLACEFDKHCQNTIKTNNPNTPVIGDITEYTVEDILNHSGLEKGTDIDLIAGGPPCQAFSTAGKRQGFNDDRGNAFLYYINLAIQLNPKYIVIENVRGLLSAPMNHRPHNMRGDDFPELGQDELRGGALNFVISEIKKAGYGYSFNLYNSANYGTPQIRERVIMICSRDGSTPPFIPPTHSQDQSFSLPEWNTFKGAVKGLKEHNHINFPEKRLKYYRLLKEGQNWKNLSDEMQREAMGKSYFSGGGKTGFLRRLAYDKPSPTLLTHPAMPATDLAHPKEDRPLSVEEYKRIQEFPDTWEITGPILQQYKQIGNAVPKGLGSAVGKIIIDLLNKKTITNPENFKYSRYKNTNHISWQKEFDETISKNCEKVSSPQSEMILDPA